MFSFRQTATDVQIGEGVDSVAATPESIRRRYRENKNWRSNAKEYIYRRLTMLGIEGRTALDFGCGTGEISTQLAFLGAQVTGIDVTGDLLSISRRRAELDGVAGQCRFVAATLAGAHFPAASFDYIVCFAVLHHIENFRVEVPRLLLHLKPGGAIFFCEPIALSAWLDGIRNKTPVPKPPLDPGERQLTLDDVSYLRSLFESSDVAYFRLLERLERIFPSLTHPLAKLDAAIRGALPFTRRWHGTIVIEGRRPLP